MLALLQSVCSGSIGVGGLASKHAAGESIAKEGSETLATGGRAIRERCAADPMEGPCQGAMAWAPPARTYVDAALSGSVYEVETSTGNKEVVWCRQLDCVSREK